MKNVLILANSDSGLYKFRKEVVEKIKESNEVYISCPNGEFVNNFIEMGCHFIETTISRHGTNPIEDLKLLKFYKKIIKQIKPNVVLTYTIKPNVYGGMACRKMRVPYIVNVTGLGNAIENPGLLQKISLFLYRKGLKNAQKVFFQNSDNMNFMLSKKVVKCPCDLLPGSGVNLESNKFEEYPTDDNTLNFVTIGRVLRDKGIFELFDAIRIIKQKHNNVHFQLIGGMDGDFDNIVNSAVKEDLIEYLGRRNDVHELIKNSHATIHPSYHEGTSNVLLETASCGRPIIATDVPGCNNTFDEGVSGISCKPKDAQSLAEAIEKFISLPYEEKVKMGQAGRIKMEREFDRNIVVKKYLEEIEKIEG